MKKKTAFTLAELLITISVIGIVAVMTIPQLVNNYQQKAWSTACDVFEKKLEQALKVMNTQGILAGYKTTEDFVSELSKHIKITKICKNDDLMGCFEDKVLWGSGTIEPSEVDMSKLKKAKHFGQDTWDTNLVGVQFLNGITGVLAYNPDCRQEPYNNKFIGSSCISILYDVTGYKSPNTSGKDLASINVIKLGRTCYLETADGSCWRGQAFIPNPITKEECLTIKNELGIKECISPGGFSALNNQDYWGGAVKQCGGIKHMPTGEQLAALAQFIYPAMTGINSGITYCPDKNDCAVEANARLVVLNPFHNHANSDDFKLWSSEEWTYPDTKMYYRSYSRKRTSYNTIERDRDSIYAICVD